MNWIPVSERLPDSSKNVFAYYKNSLGKGRIVKAFYVYENTIESLAEGDYEVNDEYNEDDDTYYIKSGWYEVLDNLEEYGSVIIYEGEVSHWHEMLEPPKDIEA